MTEKVLMKAMRPLPKPPYGAAPVFYFGYPITPQSEIPEYLSVSCPKGRYVPAGGERAGCDQYGLRRGGGWRQRLYVLLLPRIALMQEGLSFLCSAEVPLVILNVSRGGPVSAHPARTGGLFPGYRGGGNGDYKIPVFAPASIRRLSISYEAIPLADYWQNPVFIFADGMMAR
jgi:2-oxoglutarate ferredoxin oxidoreductase subunit alpha